MDQQTLQLFSRQLAHWAENAISQGRFPFRKVETFPSLLTEKGEMHPPLVFWINRASCMAAGILILPPQDAEEGVAMGRECARALGLRHFVTWAAHEIVFWEERGEALTLTKTLPLSGTENATAGFRRALLSVMDELKVLSVLGAVPPGRLSPYYLANLCRGTLLSVLPGLAEDCRAARGENRLERGQTPEILALHKGMMTLLRLVGLTAHDLLLPTVQPEGLERAMRFALDNLPPGPRRALLMPEEEWPLPAEEAVAFHHLFRRLVQLGPGEDRTRYPRFLEILLDHETEVLGGFLLPVHPHVAEGSSTLLINPDRLHRVGGEVLETASIPFLAFTSLLRDLQDLPPARMQSESVLALSPEIRPGSITGTLKDTDVPQVREHQALAAQLRSSWPTRRFPLPPRTPRWTWEFLHLLGLAEDGAIIDLHLPDAWLTADFGAPLIELIKEQFTLSQMEVNAEAPLRIRLIKSMDKEATARLIGPQGSKELSWQRICSEHRAFLPLGLHLSASLFSLLEEGFLHLPSASSWPDGSERELYLFSRSPLGRLLWETVSGCRPLPPREQVREEALQRGLPIPTGEILENLRLLPGTDDTGLPRQTDFDKELELWLETDFKNPEAARSPARRQPLRRTQKTPISEELAEEIARRVFVDGLPRFPEQYMYGYYRPRLVEYTFSGPLIAEEEFFDRFTLRDRNGRLLDVEGTETAQALLLASCDGRSTVALPEDRHLTATIVERYRSDLKAMHRNLVQQAHIRLTDPQAADSLASMVWRSALLPPWELVDI
jgi:hypothetical protein